MNIFFQHTSAAITINENSDPTVLSDMENFFRKLVPEREHYYSHDAEGNDDMPAHIKSSLTGTSLTIPIVKSKIALGTWQGIYLCEFRNQNQRRKIVLTVFS